MCPQEGILQDYLDGELDKETAARVAGHLVQCSICQQRLTQLAALAEQVNTALGIYRQSAGIVVRPLPVPKPWLQPWPGQPLTKPRGISNMIRKHKWFSGAVAAVLALGLFLSWAPGRSLAAQFLNVFRMEKIQVVKFTPQDMAQLEALFNGRNGEVDINNFGRVEVRGQDRPVLKVDAAQVEGLTRLRLELPAKLAGRQRMAINVEQAPTVTFTLDVENLNSYLAKHSGYLLPAELEGKSFTLSIPPLIRADYGRPAQNTDSYSQQDGFTLYAARDLTLDAPQGVELAALRQALLSLPFLPDNLRRQLAAINDWQRTMPIPDTGEMPAREVQVNGYQGVYFGGDSASGRVILAWRQGNSWRAISGLPLEAALQVAAEVN